MAAPGRADGGRGRAFSALLEGRAKKQTCKNKNLQQLQEAALCILSCHQNLGDLFLEVGGSRCEPESSSNSGTLGSEASGPELLVVSALRDQASLLGMPIGILAAKTAASNLEKISADSGQVALLNAEQRNKLSCLIQTLKDLLTRNAFCRLLFAQEIWKMQSPLILELVWRLHREGIVSLEELLESTPDVSTLVDWLCSSLRLVCHQAEKPSLDAEPPLNVEPLGCRLLQDSLAVLLRHGFQDRLEPGKKQELEKTTEACRAALERMLTWVLDAAVKEKLEDASTLKAVKCWLCVFGSMAAHSTVPPNSLKQFLSHTLTQVLTYDPQLKVSDAISLQREWSFARSGSVLTTLYRKLFVMFGAEDLIHQLQQVLETSEVNWCHVLSCVSTLLICHAEAEPLVKDLLGRLLTKAFENYDLESMITAFLIVRQAALEGPAVFVPYSEWFKAAFGSAGGLHSGSKKASVFLFKFLSDLVPFEGPQYLKVHILHPPFVPSKYRPFLLEYVTLAKTRLADLKVSIEDMGLYEDLSSTKEAVQPQSQALQDAEKAVQIFEATRKIPVSVMEASIFRRSYYISHFIPALLMPRVLPEIPDSRMTLIESLKRAEKIPPSTYAAYVEECRALKEKLLPGGTTGLDISDREEPLELLRAELEGLRELAADESRHDGVPAQIAIISEKLSRVLGSAAEGEEAASPGPRIKLDLSAPEVERQHQEVVDLLLSSFCQNVIAASYFLPPERQGAWPSHLVRTICGFRRLLPSLLGRLCQLLCHQSRSLNDTQVVGLATLAVHLNEAGALIPEVDLCVSSAPCSASVRGLSVPELWDHLLVCRTGESAVFCMRFCTAALAYFSCKFPSLSHGERCRLLHPGFVKKLQYLVPRFHLEARGHGFGDAPAELPWETFFQPTPCSREAALCLWKQAHFRELLQESAFQLTLQEWLLMELEVHPDGDVLSACERQEFHHWALHQHFLPAPAAAGGCDGDLSEVCAVLIGTILDFWQRSELDKCRHLTDSRCPVPRGRGNAEIHSRLQEMLLELEHRRAPLDSRESRGHFLFSVFRERLNALGTGSAVGERLPRQQELLLQSRILLSLPPAILIATRHRGRKTSLDCEDFFSFVNTELKNISSRGYTLSYDITAHFFRGLLGASLECDDPAQEVTAVLALCQARSPVILCSAARWWRWLEPVLRSEWRRLFGSAPAQGLRTLQELQSSVSGFLSSDASFPLSDIPWISAAFLHFTIQQQTGQEKPEGVLKRLGAGAEQLLGFLLFFSVVDLVSTRVAPQEGPDAHKSLAWSSEVLRHLGSRGVSWLALFSSAEKGQSPHQILRGAVSEQHLRLLPLAFYSVLLTVEAEQLPTEQAFLAVAVDMYAQLLQLFVDGAAVEGRLPASKPEDSLALIRRARQFLLCAIARCPRGATSSFQQALGRCGVLDPEMEAALVNWGTDRDLSDEELLLF